MLLKNSYITLIIVIFLTSFPGLPAKAQCVGEVETVDAEYAEYYEGVETTEFGVRDPETDVWVQVPVSRLPWWWIPPPDWVPWSTLGIATPAVVMPAVSIGDGIGFGSVVVNDDRYRENLGHFHRFRDHEVGPQLDEQYRHAKGDAEKRYRGGLRHPPDHRDPDGTRIRGHHDPTGPGTGFVRGYHDPAGSGPGAIRSHHDPAGSETGVRGSHGPPGSGPGIRDRHDPAGSGPDIRGHSGPGVRGSYPHNTPNSVIGSRPPGATYGPGAGTHQRGFARPPRVSFGSPSPHPGMSGPGSPGQVRGPQVGYPNRQPNMGQSRMPQTHRGPAMAPRIAPCAPAPVHQQAPRGGGEKPQQQPQQQKRGR